MFFGVILAFCACVTRFYCAPLKNLCAQASFHRDALVMPGSDRASLLLQRLGRVGVHEAEGLQSDG